MTDYLDAAGLTPYLEKLGFALVGFGCTTCIGNSGPLPDEVADAVDGRTTSPSSPSCRATATSRDGSTRRCARATSPRRRSWSRTRSPVTSTSTCPRDPLGDRAGRDAVYLRDLWPSPDEVREAIAGVGLARAVRARVRRASSTATSAGTRCRRPTGPVYAWDPASTYVQEPPFFGDLDAAPSDPGDIVGARCLVKVGDSITTDHISPAGSIKVDSPAGRYLIERGVAAAGLQLLRRAAREPRGDDARDVRERPAAQRARAGHARARGRRTCPTAR